MDDLYELLTAEKEKKELEILDACNDTLGRRFGLALTEDETKALVKARNQSLEKYKRVEFGRGILDKLMYAFCDSMYICQDTYAEILMKLQDIFYEFKNESQDRLTDDELIAFMKEQFETVCFGDTEYLESTCLPRFAAAVRAGYHGYERSGGKGEYDRFSEEERWDAELYMEALKTLF